MTKEQRRAAQKKELRLKHRGIGRRWIRRYVKDNPCVDCGERDWRVIEFDHRDRALKKAAISNLITRGALLERIQKEVALCDPRCANCHRRRTIKQLKWYRR